MESEQLLVQILSELKEVKSGQVNTNERLDKVDERLGRVETRLDKVDERLGRVETRLDKVDERLGKVDIHLDKVDDHLSKIDTRLDKVDDRLGKVELRLDKLEAKQQVVFEQTGNLLERNEEMMARFDDLATKEDLEYFDQKIGIHEREIFKLKQRT